MKKLTALVLAFVLLMPQVASALSVVEAVELGIKNSAQLQVYRSDVDLSEIALDEAKMAKAVSGSPGTPSVPLVKEGYYTKQAELNLDLVRKIVDDYKKQVELKVKTDYFSYKAAKDRQEKAFLAYSYANENLWVVHSKYQVGLATQLEDMQATVNKQRANDDREAAARAADLARIQLCATLGLPLDSDFEVIDELVVPNASNQPKPDEVMKTAVDNNTSVIQSRNAVELAHLQLDISKKHYGTHSNEYNKADITVDSSQAKRDVAVTNAKISVYKLYNDMVNSYESAQTLSGAVSLAEQVYLIAVARYDIGMIPNAEVLNAFASFKDAQLAENQAKLAAVINIANYEMAVK